ncbi:MAG: enoyl-CoA hydratase/isomerase family protein [Xanthobacteraceae bacterium]
MNTLLIQTEGAIVRVTLNRPDKRNAISGEMRTELFTAFAAFDADPAVRVVIVTGAGSQAFSAGGDLSATPMSPPEIERPRIVEPLDRFAKPTIAAINGLAYGGGLEIALACDIRIAATTARFALPEVKIGSMAGSGGTQRLVTVVGPTLAARMILTGEPIDAGRALAAGLVSELCEPDRLMESAMTIATTIARNAPLAVIASKRSMRLAAGMHVVEELDFERELFKELALTEDRAEGRAAFREKRAPVFKGK